MWKKSNSIIWVLCTVGFTLLPFADKRILDFLPVYPLDVVAGMIILASLVFISVQSVKIQKFSSSTIWIALAIFLGSSALSWALNNPNLTGLGQLKSWIILPSIAGFLIASLLRTQKSRDENFLQTLFFGSVVLLIVLMPYLLFGARTFDDRLQGPFTSPNFLAFFLVPGILLSFYFWKQANNSFQRIVFGVAAGLFTFALLETHSFGAWLSLFGGAFWYFFQTTRFEMKGLLKAGIIGLVFLAVFIGVELMDGNKLANIFEERSSLASRVTIWSVATDAIKDNPILGVGVGKFQEVYLSYQPSYPPYLEWAAPQPHNILLAIWLQAGVAGLIVFFWFLWKIFTTSLTHIYSKEHILLQGLLVAILVYGIFDTPLFGNGLAFFFWLVLAFLLFPQIKPEKNS